MAKERARLKAQREQEEKEEKVSRAVAGVTHLDIPAELAFVFNKIEGNHIIQLVPSRYQTVGLLFSTDIS